MPNITPPTNYKSVFGRIVYRIDSLDSAAVNDIEVIDVATSTLLGAKRYFNRSSVEMNIANYLQRRFDIEPIIPTTSSYFNKENGRSVSAAIRVGDTTSATGTYLASIGDRTPKQMLSRIVKRVISAGECDEISFLLDGSDISASIAVDCNTPFTYLIEQSSCSSGVWTLQLSMDDLLRRCQSPATVTGFTVTVAIDSQRAHTIDYTVASKSADAVRLSWVNSSGAIDSFTFRNLSHLGIENSKRRIVTETGYKTVGSKADKIIGIRSDYRPQAQIEALSEIICSPKVWRLHDGRFRPVDILTDRITIGRDSLAVAELEIRDCETVKYQSF